MHINYVSVLEGSFFTVAFGFIWFDILFGEVRAGLNGKSGKERPQGIVMARSLLIGFIGALFGCYVFAWLIEITRTAPFGGTPTVGCALATAFMTWVGFYLPFQLNRVAWEFKKWRFVAINSSFELIRFLALALLFWKR